MTEKRTRSSLKKEFFAGNLSNKEFKLLLKSALRYRGYYIAPGKPPKWSGPFRDTKPEADDDNASYFDLGYKVDIYVE